ncbi:hypothetical protein DFH07DRAFT_853383 [Mycena maculata]|uniref:RRM domain-containing protein n=1 Tax=Mycena maculata TaxID=230809 RepID=A0AAD7HRJ1_9AGAR|nr:hypothetical protein DFH07DRAFT_853383 [Mycena maculata]
MTTVRQCKKQTQPAPRKANVCRVPSPPPTPSSAPNVRKTKRAAKESASTVKPAAKDKGKGQKKHLNLVDAATAAQKKKFAQARANLLKGRFPMGPWVHIGNLDPEVTEEELEDHFAEAGEVQSVTIRYSPGMSPQTGYTYAIIVFKNRHDARVALDLNGSQVMGSDYAMVVEPELHELPEVRQLAQPKKPTKGKSKLSTRAVQTASGVTQPLALEKTEIWSARPAVARALRRAKRRGRHLIVDGTSFTLTAR